MSTTLYPLYGLTGLAQVSHSAVGESYTRLNGTDSSMDVYYASTTPNNSVQDTSHATVDGPTNGLEFGSYVVWLSDPLAAAVTVSGSITFNLWAAEGSMSANCSINCLIRRLQPDGTYTTVHKTVRTGESATSSTKYNWAETPGAGVDFAIGDRVVIVPFGDDAGTMGAGYYHTFYYNAQGNVSGDSFVTFTETMSFLSAPGGTVVYPTDTASSVNPGSAIEKEAWTSRGGGVQTSSTTTVAGPTSKIQATATAGGTAVEWYTKGLAAVTLSGRVDVNSRGSHTGTWCSLRCEIAVCDSDGTNPVVWAISGTSDLFGSTEAALAIIISGPAVSITDGKRLRIRFYWDDSDGQYRGNLMSSGTAALYYAGSAGATGDIYLTFPITLTEYSSGGGGGGEMPYVGGGYYP